MHDCLLISEIVEQICGHFYGITGGPHCLAVLARTCRTFYAPALDQLWSDQAGAGVVNLLRCMPSDLCEFDNDDDGSIRLLRPILPTDWERPLVYTHRIRSITCYFPRPDIWTALSASLPGDVDSVFPKLTTLHLLHLSMDILLIRTLLSPKLASFRIHFQASIPNFSFLPSIPRICPALKNIELQIDGDMDYGRSALSSCIQGLTSLESAWLHIPNLAILEQLSQLHALTSLHTSLNRTLSNDLSSLSAPLLPFIALKRLGIGFKIEAVTHFFRRCSGAPLQDIEITLASCSPTTAIHMLYSALREGCSHTSLLSLSVEEGTEDIAETGDDAYAINIQSLRLLFCFVNLTSIYITSYVGFNVDDGAMKELALAWPKIKLLQLRFRSHTNESRPYTQLSLRCLYTLAKYCPTLTELEVTLDATVIPKGPDIESQPVIQSALRDFNAGKSSISQPTIHVAQYISELFPNLSELTTCRTLRRNDDPDELERHSQEIAYHNLWMEVALQIPVLTATHEEERSWAEE
ncbi:F-box domain-containing protein [Mycena sanguinolenta]|uniref:F-box domain-containing protein n=1 Tax=Mycena sanguinolenta TaxID=230812 RepID=A0A8H6YGV7_9AGAR|nr:F-box domain-containing protein [Mycena sanguinolenta]